MRRYRREKDEGHVGGGGPDSSALSGIPPGHRGAPAPADDFDDPLLRGRLQSLLSGTTAPAPLVHAVEREARRLSVVPIVRNPWAELLPALASVGLVGSLLAGALTSLPIGKGMLQIASGGGGGAASLFLVLGGVAMPLVALLTLEILRGAPLLRRLVR